MVNRGEVLQCSDGLSNKVLDIVRKHIDNMKLLLMYSLGCIFYQCIYGFIPVWYCNLCNLCIFIIMSMYSYCMFMYLHRVIWHSSSTLTEVFPCFFLSYKANARVKPAKMGHGPHSFIISVLFFVFLLFYVLFVFLLFYVLFVFLLFYVLFVLCHSVYCLCVNVYCTKASGWLPNCS